MFLSARHGLLLVACLSISTLAWGQDQIKTLYAGPADASNWVTNHGNPLPEANAQADGLNPHGSGGYIVMYKEPAHDLVLDFEYKLSPGCNSGVFLRVGNPEDPVMTGLEIAIDDTTGAGYHDTGAIYDLVKPSTNAQKPAGQWNHMTITARGPIVTVAVNGKEVSRLDHSEFKAPGKRPDGSDHKFSKVAISDLNQKGFFGFQDHGQDSWYRDVKVQILD